METDSFWSISGFFKACVAGFIIIVSCNLAQLIQLSFDVGFSDDFAMFVLYIILPIVILLLVMLITNKILSRYGFDGLVLYESADKRKFTIAKIVGLFIGFVLGSFANELINISIGWLD